MKLIPVGVLAAMWIVVSTSQVRIAQDPLHLWQQAVQVSPQKPRPRVNLGTEYWRRGGTVLAQHNYDTALRLSRVRPLRERGMTRTVVEVNRARMALDLLAWLAVTS